MQELQQGAERGWLPVGGANKPSPRSRLCSQRHHSAAQRSAAQHSAPSIPMLLHPSHPRPEAEEGAVAGADGGRRGSLGGRSAAGGKEEGRRVPAIRDRPEQTRWVLGQGFAGRSWPLASLLRRRGPGATELDRLGLSAGVLGHARPAAPSPVLSPTMLLACGLAAPKARTLHAPPASPAGALPAGLVLPPAGCKFSKALQAPLHPTLPMHAFLCLPLALPQAGALLCLHWRWLARRRLLPPWPRRHGAGRLHGGPCQGRCRLGVEGCCSCAGGGGSGRGRGGGRHGEPAGWRLPLGGARRQQGHG